MKSVTPARTRPPFDYTLEISARIKRTKPQPRPKDTAPNTTDIKTAPPGAKPQILMGGARRLMSHVASELGTLLKDSGFYNLHGQPAFYEPKVKTLRSSSESACVS